MSPIGQCLRPQSGIEGLAALVGGYLPFQQSTFFTFEPPFFFLHQARRLVIKYDILKKTLDLGYQERKIRYTRCLDEIALETPIAVCRELFGVDAYLQWDCPLPDEPAEQGGGRWRRSESGWRVAYGTKGRHRGGRRAGGQAGRYRDGTTRALGGPCWGHRDFGRRGSPILSEATFELHRRRVQNCLGNTL
jgi:hypothetical protein